MNVLTFIAHPDDETILTGGVLALLAEKGACVHYLCATRGEGGEAGTPPLCSREELGVFRSLEMKCAVQALGGSSLTFLDYIDPTVGPNNELFAFAQDLDEVAHQVIKSMQSLSIDAVITHGSNGEYGHPAHLLAHQAACRAFEILGDAAPLLYSFQASYPGHPKPHLENPNDPADLILNIASVIEKKQQAALCHRTQHALFVRSASKEAGHPVPVPQTILSIESLHRIWPANTGNFKDEITELLKDVSLSPSH